MGLNYKPTAQRLHARWFNGWRSRSPRKQRFSSRMGHRHRRQHTDPISHDGYIRVQTQCTCRLIHPSHVSVTNRTKSARLPYRGVPVSTEGQEHVPSSVGPMARSLDAIHAAFKSLVELQPWDFDARCAAVPWREDVYQSVLTRPLVIGVLLDDEVVRPHPPIVRVLRSAVEALRGAGHCIVDWNARLHAECVDVMVSAHRYGQRQGTYRGRRISIIESMAARIFGRL